MHGCGRSRRASWCVEADLSGVDWSWLLILAKRIKAAAPHKPRKYHLVTSDRLYALGIELMDHAAAEQATPSAYPRRTPLNIETV